MNFLKSIVILLSAWLLLTNPGYAAQRIAILNFELNDITFLPNTPQEQQRTASLRPLLEQALSNTGGYEIVGIDNKTQGTANSSFGYLFRFHELAAKLGNQSGSDWVVVSQHSKPSFLYSHLWVHLINVKSRNLIASYAIELKGTHEKVTERGIKALADKIHATINR